MAETWDRHSIRAELNRRGYTLTKLALDNGLYESACRQALDGRCYAGAKVIAKALGRTVRELWPDRYLNRRHDTATTTYPKASQKRTARADAGRVA